MPDVALAVVAAGLETVVDGGGAGVEGTIVGELLGVALDVGLDGGDELADVVGETSAHA